MWAADGHGITSTMDDLDGQFQLLIESHPSSCKLIFALSVSICVANVPPAHAFILFANHYV